MMISAEEIICLQGNNLHLNANEAQLLEIIKDLAEEIIILKSRLIDLYNKNPDGKITYLRDGE